MPAATYNFKIEQGTTLLKPVVWKDSNGAPVNLTGYTAKMQIRASAYSDEVLLELSTTNGRITLDAVAGKVTLIFSPTITSAINWRRGKYDLELTAANGTVTRLIEGEITVSQEVTR